MGASNHAVSELLRAARREGFRVERTSGGHFAISTPDGRSMIMRSTPGSEGAIKRARSQLRRLARGDRSVRE